MGHERRACSSNDDSGISTSGTDGGISELDGSVTTDAATAGPSDASDASDANADEDGCWWCTEADANSAPETLAGDDSGKGGGGGGKGDDGKGDDDGKGTDSDTCYEDCIDKGAGPDECLEACGDDDEGDDEG